jgi:hypothetical protein
LAHDNEVIDVVDVPVKAITYEDVEFCFCSMN